jgi:hypothetical protein
MGHGMRRTADQQWVNQMKPLDPRCWVTARSAYCKDILDGWLDMIRIYIIRYALVCDFARLKNAWMESNKKGTLETLLDDSISWVQQVSMYNLGHYRMHLATMHLVTRAPYFTERGHLVLGQASADCNTPLYDALVTMTRRITWISSSCQVVPGTSRTVIIISWKIMLTISTQDDVSRHVYMQVIQEKLN